MSLREGAKDGSLRSEDDPIRTAVAIFGAVTISGLSHLVGGGGVPVDDVVARLVGLVLEGLDPR